MVVARFSLQSLERNRAIFGRQVPRPEFAVHFIGRFTLGRHAGKMTPEQQADFREAFGEFILKTYARRVRETVAAGDQEAAETALRRANRAYDRAASKGVIHKNNAANHKARLARSVNRQGQ